MQSSVVCRPLSLDSAIKMMSCANPVIGILTDKEYTTELLPVLCYPLQCEISAKKEEYSS